MGNMLDELWKNLWEAKIKRLQAAQAARVLPKQPFEQHYSEDRQAKNRLMKALHIKTGKAYRKYLKDVRRENKESEAKLMKPVVPYEDLSTDV